MRSLLLAIVLMTALSLQAQMIVPLTVMDYTHRTTLANMQFIKDSTPNKKWFVNTYTGIYSGINFFKGGNATVLAVPLGIQLNRKLTDNWYAFAAVSVAPAYISFNGSYMAPVSNKTGQNKNFFNPSSLGIYSRAEMGLMYTNEAKTFSISGSIGIEKSSYPIAPYYPVSAKRLAAVYPKN